MQENIKYLNEILNKPSNIVITTHRGPDGDAMGSSLGLKILLNKLGHKVKIITPNNYAEFLHWLPENNTVLIYEDEKERCDKITNEADVIFMLDLNCLSRLDQYANSIKKSNAVKILIDHHLKPDLNIADIFFSEINVSSTSELIYEIILMLKLKKYISLDIATCIYVGILTDTGSFRYSNTSERTHVIVSELIKIGVNSSEIYNLIYNNNSINRMKLIGYCLQNKLNIYPEHKSAIIYLDALELKKFNFKKGDTEGLINFALAIKGITFAIFIAEKDGITKLSLRSKGDIDVSEIAKKYFNGGGHKNASGGISKTTVNETVKLSEKIIHNLKK